jgi:hypothetical protein
MPTYVIEVTEEVTGFYTVTADSAADAATLARDAHCYGGTPEVIDGTVIVNQHGSKGPRTVSVTKVEEV